MIPRPVEVKPLENFRIWLRYDDGTEGEVNLSDVAGRGVFEGGIIGRSLKLSASVLIGQSSWTPRSTFVLTRCTCG